MIPQHTAHVGQYQFDASIRRTHVDVLCATYAVSSHGLQTYSNIELQSRRLGPHAVIEHCQRNQAHLFDSA